MRDDCDQYEALAEWLHEIEQNFWYLRGEIERALKRLEAGDDVADVLSEALRVTEMLS